MNDEIKFPLITRELIDSLSCAFPDTLPKLSNGERIDDFGLGFLYGNREVIDRLEVEYQTQQLDIMEEARKQQAQENTEDTNSETSTFFD